MRRRGFTLVELLVVVAVVALLISLLLPSLALARHAARSTMCAANIRSLCIAQLAYANDRNGQLVMFGLSHGGSGAQAKLSWTVELQNYSDSPLDIKSPLDASPHWPRGRGGTGQHAPNTSPPRFRVSSYGLNEYVTPKPPFDPANPNPKKHDKIHLIRNPVATAQWVMMAYQGNFSASDHVHASGWWDQDAGPDASAALASVQVQIDAVGPKGGTPQARANYGFLDAHAGPEAFGNMYRTPTDNRFDPRFAR